MGMPVIYLLDHGPHDKVPGKVQKELLSPGPRLIIESYTPESQGSGVFHESYTPGSPMSPYVRYVEESTRDEEFGNLEAGYSRLLHKLIVRGKRKLDLFTGFTELDCVYMRDYDGLAQVEAEKAVFVSNLVQADPSAKVVCGGFVYAGLMPALRGHDFSTVKNAVRERIYETTCRLFSS